jgi:hypothetical protein
MVDRHLRFSTDEVQTTITAAVAMSQTDGAIVFDGSMDLVAAGAFLKV